MSRNTSRRDFIKGASIVAATLAIPSGGQLQGAGRASPTGAEKYPPLKGNLKHSVVRWTFSKLSLDELCLAVKQIGFSAISHVGPKDWPTLKRHGVDCSMCWGAVEGWRDGLATKKVQDEMVTSYLRHIDLVADAGYRNLLCYTGTRRGMDLDEGLTNTETSLKRILGHAEKRGVMLVMSMWNTKEYPDYLCNTPAWGVTLCKRLGSPNFGLTYDPYHMQLMEGNIIDTISRYHEYFVYYQTGGVPGRCELTAPNQELNYPAICRTIVETGYRGYLAQEFIPSSPDIVASLREAIYLCDV